MTHPFRVDALHRRAVARRQRAQQLAEVPVDPHEDAVARLDQARHDSFQPRARRTRHGKA